MNEDRLKRSREAFERACGVLVGGVNSPVRAYGAVGGVPPFIRRGRGARVTDIDGNCYIDYVGSWGPLILGHAHPIVVSAVCEAVVNGSSFGAPTEGETKLAEMIRECVPSMQRVRLVSSGTEAVMSALRLARAATGRELVVKFEGCYHGHTDGMLVSAGSGATTFGRPTSAGVPQAIAGLTAALPYNDTEAVRRFMHEHGGEVACIIVEPVAGNMGVVAPVEGFLAGLRSLCTEHGALLIFDEVITGFRLGLGGAQGLYGVKPDLTTLGKVIGGGLPVGAYGGSASIMENVSPTGGVYQAGTLSGNPVVVAAGLATLGLLKRRGFYAELDAKGEQLEKGLEQSARSSGVSVRVNRVGSMLTAFFTQGEVRNYAHAKRADERKFARFHARMLTEGIYLPPSQYEAWFVSAAHGDEELSATEKTLAEAMQGL